MVQQKRQIDITTADGESFTIGSTTLTPIVQRISLGLPQWITPAKGFVFFNQQPIALRVKNIQETYMIRIIDVEKMILTLMVLTSILSLSMLFWGMHKEKNQ
jgi:hypothetical protein